MRLSRILMLIGALALPVLPAAAQGKALGKPAGVGKPTTTVKGAGKTVTKGKSAAAKSGTLVKGKSADHAKGPKSTTVTDTTTDTTAASDSKGRGLPLARKSVDDTQRRASRPAAGATLTYEQATTG